MAAAGPARSSGLSLTVLMIAHNQERSRDFYHDVLGAGIVRHRDPVILRFHHGIIALTAGGGPPRRHAHGDHGAPR